MFVVQFLPFDFGSPKEAKTPFLYSTAQKHRWVNQANHPILLPH
ncbi:hypothetical protein AM1_4163 [Acaryochloris marina MBIC11017]|uniref:Uncharacterized protein n=1 Tax=Acaryochloris marina (strain MBIC 11017) TaxID=329726 RepID=B0CBM6_ACAM1|nr:hypothetical protein AM1_4163 [Acaryochloris marina MBIC11017]